MTETTRASSAILIIGDGQFVDFPMHVLRAMVRKNFAERREMVPGAAGVVTSDEEWFMLTEAGRCAIRSRKRVDR